jgi:hypothetical protein
MTSSTLLYYWLAALSLAAATCWSLYKFAASMRRDRLIEDTPLAKIRSAAQGYVKVFGHAKTAGSEVPTSPLSSRPCVWWAYDIEQKQRNAKGETHWRSIDSAASTTPFLLADEDGECLVGPIGAEITPTCHDVWYGDAAWPSGPPIATRGYLGTDAYRYTERMLRAGDQLSVTGDLRSNSEISSTDSASVAMLREWKLDQPSLLARFDANHDGKIDPSEWESARQAAIQQSHAETLKSSIVRTSCIGAPTRGEPFLIAPMDSAHLARRERLFAVMFFVLGLASAGCCAWTIQHAQSLASI